MVGIINCLLLYSITTLAQNYYCGKDNDCTLDCYDKYGYYECYQKVIDATNSSSLTVDCTGYRYGCQQATIHCPVSSNNNPITECHIYCAIKNGCEDVTIFANHTTNISLHCNSQQSCLSVNMYASYANIVKLNCSNTGSAERPDYMGSCQGLYLYAENVSETIDVFCSTYEYNGCFYSHFYFDNANNISIISTSYGHFAAGMSNVDVHASNANQFYMLCTAFNYGCTQSTYYLPENIQDDKIKIVCEGFGCYLISLFNLKESSHDIMTLNGCGVCHTVYQCLGYNYISVDRMYLLNSFKNNFHECHLAVDGYFNYTKSTFICEENQECILQSVTDRYDIIDGTQALSLKLLIQGGSYHGYDKILCPTKTGSTCDILCLYGCDDTEIYLNDTATVNISCTGSGSCSWTYLYGNINSTTINWFNYKNSHVITNLAEGEYKSNDFEKVIQNSDSLIGTFIYPNYTNESKCIQNNGGIIDCSVYNCNHQCIASNSDTSLTVLCNKQNGCISTTIYCHSRYCDIICSEFQSCSFMEIFGYIDNILSMDCLNDKSCRNNKIFAATSREININCNQTNACFDFYIDGTDSNVININCEQSLRYTSSSYSYFYPSCYLMFIHATNVSDTINVTCDGEYSCFASYLYANNASKVNVNGYDDLALYHYHIYAEYNNSLTLSCNGYSSRSCYDVQIHSSSLFATINCEGINCFHLQIQDFANISVNINSCGHHKCYSIGSCIGEWDVTCATYQQFFTGNRPNPDDFFYDVTCQNEIINHTSFIDDITLCSFWPIPTMDPTNAPTNSPTNAPSTAPTLAPTDVPTRAPSNYPTTNPSNYPTSVPSNYPTTTSNYPTSVPSNYPSSNPTNLPSPQPSYEPSMAPTFGALSSTTIVATETKQPSITLMSSVSVSTMETIVSDVLQSSQSSTQIGKDGDKSNSTNTVIIWVVVSVFVAIVFCCISIGFFVYLKRKREKQSLSANMRYTAELVDVTNR